MIALFDGAERAVRGVQAMVRAVDESDRRIRAGVHTGEVEYLPDSVQGVAVHVVLRITAPAGPGEVLDSDTARGLIETRDITLVDRDRHALKGVVQRRTLYAVG